MVKRALCPGSVDLLPGDCPLAGGKVRRIFLSMKPILFLVAAALVMLSGCSGFQPIHLEHDDKEQLDYREGDYIPKNT